MFSIDTETGFDKVVLINAAWGLGETVVQGAVDPDEYLVFKPLLSEPALMPIVEKRLRRQGTQDDLRAGGGGATAQRADAPGRNAPAFVLTDDDILALARWAVVIEEHYGRPDGHGMGARTARPASSSSCRRGPRRCNRATRRAPC